MVKRQRTAFPPNFVHSLDGSHMMMTAVACKRAGLNFAGCSTLADCEPLMLLCNMNLFLSRCSSNVAGVHDSYWTHACDVEQLNRILREKFVELYGTPILENVRMHFSISNQPIKI